MNKRIYGICFMISALIIGITLFMYPGMTENTLEQMIHHGSMPEKYHVDGWFFNYEPVEHFLWLSAAFVLVYYGFGAWLKPSKVKKGILFGLLALYFAGYIGVTIEFWQLVVVTAFLMILLAGIAVYVKLKEDC